MARSHSSLSRFWRKRKPVVLWVGGLVLLVLVLLVISRLASGGVSSPTGVQADKQAQADHSHADEVFSDIKQLIEAHYAAVGGRNKLKSLNSLRLDGNYITPDGTELGLTVIKKQPFRIRITLKRDKVDMVTGYDGEDGWQAIMRDGLAYRIQDLDGDEEAALRQDAEIHNLLYNYGVRGYKLENPELVETESGPAYKVAVTDHNGELERIYFLDKDTLLEAQSIQTRPQEDGEVRFKIVYEDYRDVEGMQLPFKVTTYRNDELFSVMEITSMDLNVGVLNQAFRKPDLAPRAQEQNEDQEAREAAGEQEG
ncbi:MAG: hypothetical protein E1N59_296 [Puniceicoccaceae bacterium 5H]|nr:MAG: hypothetical protein E1N59_296 [Puniceicoccaceae bacterium 5H]